MASNIKTTEFHMKIIARIFICIDATDSEFEGYANYMPFCLPVGKAGVRHIRRCKVFAVG